MSGNQIGSVIGAAIGYFVPVIGPSLGMSIGGFIGGVLMPDQIGLQDQQGPRLQDLKTSTSTYGIAIAKVYGAYRIGGNLIWANDIKEVKHVEEVEVGKGGSETYDVITYSYSIDMAIGLCEGPVSSINKIWADSVLIYDINRGGFADGYYNSEESSGGISIYLGTSTQNPDWFLQANNPDSPAYRGLCYLVFNTFQLEKYGNRIPNITCEVIKSDTKLTAMLPEIILPCHWSPFSDIIGVNGNTLHTLSARFSNWYVNIHFKHMETDISINRYMKYTKIYALDDVCNEGTLEEYNCSMDHWNPMSGVSLDGYTFVSFYTSVIYGKTNIYIRSNVEDCCESYEPIIIIDSHAAVGSYVYNGTYFAISNDNVYFLSIATQQIFHINKHRELDRVSVTYTADDHPMLYYYNEMVYLFTINLENLIIDEYLSDLTFNKQILIPRENSSIIEFGHFAVDSIGFHIFIHNVYIKIDFEYNIIRDITMLSSVNPAHVGNAYYKDSILYTLVNDGDPEPYYDESQWTDSTMEREYLDYSLPDGELLSNIVESLLLSSGIDQSEFDLSEGDSTLVKGFVSTNQMNARSAIATLQSVYLFDLIEEDFKIKLKLRGRDPTNSISEFILDNNKENFSVAKTIDTELPKKITVTYSNKDIDYQTSSQSTIRIEGNSDNNVSLELPIVFTDDEAKQLVEKLMYSTWYGKLSIIFKIPYMNNLKVSDIVNVTNNGIIYTVRIINMILTTDNTFEITSVNENKSTYLSNAMGQDTSNGFVDSFAKPQGPTLLEIYNSPTLSNSLINSHGVYYSASGYVDEWKGCEIFKSTDDEATYGSIGVVLNLNAIGISTVALDNGPTTIWDLDNTIEIELHTGSLNSISSENILLGENYALIGNEVIQFQNATDNLDGTYTLEDLLRGRRGTEWATGTHTVGESFIFLDSQNTQFAFSTINTERWYKAVTFGKYLSDTDTIINTYDGTNLKPFSVSNLTKDLYETNNDFMIEWGRRDRYISGHFNPLPMSEETELYKIYFYTNAMVLLRTETGILTETFTYTAQNRSDDGLFGNHEDSFKYEIVQISASIGDGYGGIYSKTSERILVNYEDLFTGINNDPPSFNFYSEYIDGTVSGESLLIQGNKLRITATMTTGRYGIQLDNQIISDFDIEFEYEQQTSPPSYSGIRLIIGDLYLFADVYGDLYYYDFDNSIQIKINSSGANGCLRMYSVDNIITYCYRDLPTDPWTEISTKVYTYNAIGQYPIIANSLNYSSRTFYHNIDNLKVLI